jgi:hypothetical protein
MCRYSGMPPRLSPANQVARAGRRPLNIVAVQPGHEPLEFRLLKPHGAFDESNGHLLKAQVRLQLLMTWLRLGL